MYEKAKIWVVIDFNKTKINIDTIYKAQKHRKKLNSYFTYFTPCRAEPK